MAESDLTITITGKDAGVLQLLNKITGGMEDLEKTSKKVTTSVSKNVNELAGSVQGLTNRVTGPFTGAIGQLIGMAGVGGFIATLKKSVVMADEWEEQMAALSVTVGDKFGGSLKEVETRIREMTKTTSISTAELMSGFQQIAKSSVKGVDTVAGSMKVLDSTQKLAVATNSELGTTVRGVTNLMGAFGMSVNDTAKVSNTLLLASQKSNMSFGELSGTMGFLANTAKEVGIGMDDMLGALVGMQRAGVPVSQSVQAMNAMIMGMLNPSKELSALVKGLPGGFSSVADMVKKVGLVGYFEALKKATGGNIEVMERYIPNMRAMRGASALVGKGLDEMKGFLDEAKGSTDRLENAFQKMVGTKEFELFMKKVTEGMREVGERMMPKVMENLNALGAWFDANRVQIIDTVVKAGEALMDFLKFVVTNADTILKVFLTIWGVEKVAGFAKSIVDLTSAFGALKGAIAALGVGKVGALLAAITGGASAAAIGGAAAVIGGTAYAAFNLAAPENKLKPSQMEDIEGMSPLMKIPNNQAWATDFAGKFADLAKQEEKIAIDAYKELAKEAGKENKKLTKEEEEALKKLHLEQVTYLKDQGDLEEQGLTELGKLQKKHREQNTAWYNKKFATELDREEAIGQLKKTQAEELRLLEYKQQSAHEAWINKVNDQAESTIEAYKEMRAQESAEAAKVQDAAAKQNWRNIAFWQEVAKGFANKVGETLFDWTKSAVDLITTPLSSIMGMFGSLFGGFQTVGSAPFQKITEIFNSILGGAGVGDVKAATEQAALFFEQLAEQLPAALDWFAKEGVPRIVEAFVSNLPTIIQSLVQNIPIIIDEVIADLDRIVLPFVDGMLQLVPALIERIPDLVAAVAELLGPAIAKIFSNLPSIIGSTIESGLMFLPKMFSGLVKGIGDFFSGPGKAEQAAKAKEHVTAAARAMGYTEEEAAAAGELAYEKKMGRAYDPQAWARYASDYEKAKALRGGKTEEEAEAIRQKIYDEQYGAAAKEMAEYTGLGSQAGGEQVDVGTRGGGGGGANTPYNPYGTEPITKEKAEGMAASAATKAYNAAYSESLADFERAWSGPNGMEAALRRSGKIGTYQAAYEKFMAEFRAKWGGPTGIEQTMRNERKEQTKENPGGVPVYTESQIMAAKDKYIKEAEEKASLEAYADINAEKTKYMEDSKEKAKAAAEEAFQKIYAKVLAEIKLLPNYIWAGKMHSGGLVEGAANLARAIRAHVGFAVPGGLSPDEVPIIAQAGEAVMNRRWVQNAGGKQAVEEMNQSGGPGGRVVNNVFVEHMMSGDTAQVVDSLISGNLRSGAGRLYDKFNAGRPAGYKTRRA